MNAKTVPSGTGGFKNRVAFTPWRNGAVQGLSPIFSGAVPDAYEAGPSSKNAPVRVWAKQYETGKPVTGASIVDLATGDRWKTGDDGYAYLSVAPGRTLTLALKQDGYPDIQTASVTVPPEGLTDENHEITLQVAGKFLYKLLRLGLGKPQPGKHHIVVTVSAEGKNLHDDEGEEGVTVTLRSADGSVTHGDPVYLGKKFGRTEWFRPVISARIPLLKRFAHQATSGDGGLIFRNVAPVFKDGLPVDYIIEASKAGPDGKPMIFSSAKVTIFPDSPEVINVSPPLGPRINGK